MLCFFSVLQLSPGMKRNWGELSIQKLPTDKISTIFNQCIPSVSTTIPFMHIQNISQSDFGFLPHRVPLSYQLAKRCMQRLSCSQAAGLTLFPRGTSLLGDPPKSNCTS